MRKIEEVIDFPEYKNMEKDIETFVEAMLRDHIPADTGKKVIHDSVWGSIEYSNWEMQLIDTPLFQRLRDINQVGLAMLTYPAARHSRFEHSLGVAAAAKMMCDKIDKNSSNFTVPQDTRNCIILAALLHDIGHCFYSHVSETIYGELEPFANLRRIFANELELTPKPHEIMAFIIINTETFQNFFFSNIDYPEKSKLEIKQNLFLDVGSMIIGYKIHDHIYPKRICSYQTAIINGPFDADKLDYIKRDSLTAGLALQYDIERLFTKIQVHTFSKGDQIEDSLVVNISGIEAVEELTFCKIMLFSYIYYHQKVLITEAMIKDYAFGLYELSIIESYADFLKYTDSDILKLANEQKGREPFPEYGNLNLMELAWNIKNRKLPRRCFEISQANVVPLEDRADNDAITKYYESIMEKIRKDTVDYTVDDFQNDIARFSLTGIRKNNTTIDNLIKDLRDLTYTDMLNMREKFYEELINEYKKQKKHVTFTQFDIYIVFPKLVNYGSITDAVVLGRDNEERMSISDFVKLDDWAGSFNSNKWRGYVFVNRKIDLKIAYNVANKLILQEKAQLKNPKVYLKGIG